MFLITILLYKTVIQNYIFALKEYDNVWPVYKEINYNFR